MFSSSGYSALEECARYCFTLPLCSMNVVWGCYQWYVHRMLRVRLENQITSYLEDNADGGPKAAAGVGVCWLNGRCQF